MPGPSEENALSFLDLTVLLGGLALFLYGMGLARESLQLAAGGRLRTIIAMVTENRILGLASGVVVTTLLQSSTATTVMLVNFTSTGLMSLGQALAVALGAGIGTTVTVQIISFKVSTYALLLVAAGFLPMFTAKRRQARYLGQLVLAFGFIFFGIDLMGQATAPLQDSVGFQSMLTYASRNPLVGLIAAALFTAVVQASAATIGLIISLAIGGSMTLDAAIPMVLGANVGTAITAILAGLGAPPDGKRIAVGYLIYKLLAAGLFLLFMGLFTEASSRTSDDLARQIANAHTIFNVVSAFVFLPLTGLGAIALTRFYRPPEPVEAFKPKYLDRRALDTPPLAFSHATREFMRMCDTVNEMLRDSIQVIERDDLDLAAEIEARDDKVDILNREIKLYLSRLSQSNLTPEQADQELELIMLSQEIENAGDIINKNILSLARKKASRGLLFSDEGWSELRDLHAKVCENFDLSLAAFSRNEEELARKVLRHRESMERLESDLRQAHIDRLHQAIPETFETSAIHMDLISYLVRVNGCVSRLAESVIRSQSRREALSQE
jgi:phosphate:Na+ symporter